MDYDQTSVLVYGTDPVTHGSTVEFSNPPLFFIAGNKDSINLPKATPVSSHPSGIGFIRAGNSGLGTAAYGVLAEDAAIGFAKAVFVQGTLVLSDWTVITGSSFLQAKANYFLGTSGLLTSSAPTTPGQISQLIGRAVSPIALEITLDSPILL